ncbi:hypothetical protein [Prosthecobacter sp.]|jgi:hypothetical protein|uniref:hypothetical protein n=1 Tax=Prosthecobacter sp. TaxID=1965333 RepID=UPI003784C379
MNTRTTPTGSRIAPWLSLSLALLATADASAQNQRYYPQQPQYTQPAPNYQQPPPGYGAPSYGYPQQPQKQYENPIEFLPKFGKRMSEVVRRIFYGQDPTGWDNPPPGYGANGGYNLDAPPRQQAAPGYPQQPPSGYYQPQQGQAQPRYNYPPQSSNQAPPAQQNVPQKGASSPASSSQAKSSTRTYTPPKAGGSSSKTQAKPSTNAAPKEPVKETPPPTTTARRSESAPPREQPSTTASSGSGSFLKGRKTAKAGRVISPYPPYKELDVTGLESGSLALDPTTQKVFEVP